MLNSTKHALMLTSFLHTISIQWLRLFFNALFIILKIHLLQLFTPTSNLIHLLFDLIQRFLLKTLIQEYEIVIHFSSCRLRFSGLRQNHLINLLVLLQSLIKEVVTCLLLLLWCILRYHIDRNSKSLLMYLIYTNLLLLSQKFIVYLKQIGYAILGSLKLMKPVRIAIHRLGCFL